MVSSFAYARATSVDDAVTRLARAGARPCAGGTDLLGCLRDDIFQASVVVSLQGIERLGGIGGVTPSAAARPGTLRIGALATIAEIARHPDVRARYAALAEAAALVASPQLRNQGTLGGNLCQRPRCWFYRGGYPCARKGGETCFAMQGDNRYHCIFGGSTCLIVHPSDTAPALVALDAQVRIAGARGERTVAAGDFFVLPERDMTKENVLEAGEIVTEILLPAPPTRSTYRKARSRGAWDFALAGAAVALTMRDGIVRAARVVLSGVAPIPWRAAAAERALEGRRLDARTLERAAEAAVAGAQPLEHNGYKVPLARGVVEEALSSLSG
jgi:xanthine dehydrogenase YagS FAD-binding subunit